MDRIKIKIISYIVSFILLIILAFSFNYTITKERNKLEIFYKLKKENKIILCQDSIDPIRFYLFWPNQYKIKRQIKENYIIFFSKKFKINNCQIIEPKLFKKEKNLLCSLEEKYPSIMTNANFYLSDFGLFYLSPKSKMSINIKDHLIYLNFDCQKITEIDHAQNIIVCEKKKIKKYLIIKTDNRNIYFLTNDKVYKSNKCKTLYELK